MVGSRLVNVRLDERHLEKARRLRLKGIALSDVVRDAIDRQYDLIIDSPQNRDVDAIMREIYDLFPDAPGSETRQYSMSDRKAAKQAILRRLRRKR